VPGVGDAYPVVVRGIRRGWWFQYKPEVGVTLSPTYLGAVADPAGTCNGVLFALPEADSGGLAWREQGYVPTPIDPAAIETLDGDVSLTGADVLFYATPEIRLPDATHPIVQSYVDICVGGCLEIEERFPRAKAGSFARDCIRTTESWQEPWINDRLLAWRPTVYEPRAWDIDDLLADALGRELFDSIKFPGR